VGAGDCFFAGLLSEIVAQPRALPLALPEETLQAALSRAVASASLCVQQAGCVPPGESLLREWIVRGSIELS
jgi:fructokinase